MDQEAIDQTNKACYDNCFATWNRFPFPNVLPEMVKKYYDPALGNKVLDVGSGTGILGKWLADQGFDVLCIDPSVQMVRLCKAKGLKIEKSTIQQYQPNGSYAMIFAIICHPRSQERNFLSDQKTNGSFA